MNHSQHLSVLSTKIPIVTLLLLVFNLPSITAIAQPKSKKVAIVVHNFFYTPQENTSELVYALRSVQFLKKAKQQNIPLGIFQKPFSGNYLSNSFAEIFKQSQFILGVDSSTTSTNPHLKINKSGDGQSVPITYVVNQTQIHEVYQTLKAQGDSVATQKFLDEYASALFSSFELSATKNQELLGLPHPFPQILSSKMSLLTADVLPLLWQKLKESQWEVVPIGEVLKHSLYKAFSASMSDKLSFYQLISSETLVSLKNFYNPSPWIQWKTELIFNQLTKEERVGQMLVVAAGRLGKKNKVVEKLVRRKQVGGILLLKGEKQEFKEMIAQLDSFNAIRPIIPLLYSADAEPSLFNRKIANTLKTPKTSSIKTVHEADSVAAIISKELKEIGILHNYAPVVDLSQKNEAIGNRSFSHSAEETALLAQAFISKSQAMQVAATAKHFPGHGFVKGDSHTMLPTINGELQEIAPYQPLIDSGLISIMVGHIAVKNNEEYSTNGIPASCSKKIVTDLLRNKMGFKGIVVTDALGMGGVQNIENAPLKAAKAGVDMLLMVKDEEKVIQDILHEMKEDKFFEAQIHQSVKRIIKLKTCLGLIRLFPLIDL